MQRREKLTLAWRGKCDPVPDIVFVDDVVPLALVVPPAAVVLRVDPWTAPDPLDLCLELWKAWMGSDSDRDLGAKTMRGLSGEGEGGGADLNETQHANDVRLAEAVDAMIDSMARIHIWAIYTSCSQATPWKFPHVSFVDVAIEAREDLTRRLKNNFCTAVLF